MLIGCGEWGFRDRPLADWVPLAVGFGFEHLEFGIGGGWPGRLPDDPSPSDTAALRRLAGRHGASMRHCCLENDFTLPDPAGHAAQLRAVLARLPAAADCGATIVRLFAGFTPADEMTEATWGRLLGALAECVAAAGRLGMGVAVETHGAIAPLPDGSAGHRHTATTRRDGLERLARAMPPGVGFNYDPGNVKATDPADRRYALDLVAGRVNYCHLKDWRRVGAGWEACAPGDDDLDYAALLPVAGFGGPYLVEYEPLGDTEAGIARSLAYLRRAFPDATLGG